MAGELLCDDGLNELLSEPGDWREREMQVIQKENGSNNTSHLHFQLLVAMFHTFCRLYNHGPYISHYLVTNIIMPKTPPVHVNDVPKLAYCEGLSLSPA